MSLLPNKHNQNIYHIHTACVPCLPQLLDDNQQIFLSSNPKLRPIINVSTEDVCRTRTELIMKQTGDLPLLKVNMSDLDPQAPSQPNQQIGMLALPIAGRNF